MSLSIKKITADSKLNTILSTKYVGRRSHYIEVGPDKVILPQIFEKYYEEIQKFEVRDDDVFVLAFPKTGSRWTQELVWLLLNNLDFEKAREVNLDERSPLLEMGTLSSLYSPENYLKEVNEMKGPRTIRSHLQWSILPKSIRDGTKQPKSIVVLRGPEDTCSSYYHQARIIEGYTGNFDEFCDLFLGGKIPLGPYWSHVLRFWEQRHRPNITFLKYDEMKSDLAGSIRKVAEFLDRNLSEDEIVAMRDYLSFDNLKKTKGFNMEFHVKRLNADTNPFVRSGTVGDHKKVMSDAVIASFKDQKQLYLEGTELNFN